MFGGFHKARIQKILNEQNYSYLIVSPKMTQADPKHQSYYQQLMSVGNLPFEVPFHIRTAARPGSVLQVRSELRQPFLSALAQVIAEHPDMVSVQDQTLVQELQTAAFSANLRSELRGSEEGVVDIGFEQLFHRNTREFKLLAAACLLYSVKADQEQVKALINMI